MGFLYDAYIRSYSLNTEDDADFFQYIDDLYFREELQGMSVYPQHGDINRVQHILSVAYLSYVLAKKYNARVKEVCRGAILHDLFYYDWHVGEKGHRLHGYRHPGFALKNARALTVLNKIEEDIIKRHMWPLTPTPPRYKESYIVTLADKYCAWQEILICRIKSHREKFQKNLNTLNKVREL
ncbi:MAG: HD domain-containing protein [Clostridiales bacterium]|nr:HD domain-containing protein [Clostridiales bacterium]HOA33780.1 HD domain-containing protein [Clostridiales bacterium]HOJ35213.1 HD domain-containing protein [Clostridiales bacterium]HPU67533.1 HD domain-containing protein [Clostridiales bacterium]HQA05397.1 HD domain-containing protein [Clostridiales bacterium]